MNRLLVVTGLVAEAEIIQRAAAGLAGADRPRVFCAGPGASVAPAAVADHARAVRDGAVLAIGLGGGLDPALGVGAVVVADAVVAPGGERLPVDRDWAARTVSILGGEAASTDAAVRRSAVAGSDRPARTVAAKRRLRTATGAAVVDMESHVLAAAAAGAGLPFLDVRVVLDPAGRAIPSAALAGMAADGGTRPGAVLARLLLRPWQIPGLLALARENATALAALRRVALACAAARFGLV